MSYFRVTDAKQRSLWDSLFYPYQNSNDVSLSFGISISLKKNIPLIRFSNSGKQIQPLTHKIAEFANSIALDEVAHDEPPQQDLHCLPSSL